MSPDPTRGAVQRRDFLASCAALVLALAGCGPVLSRTRLARLAINDPHPDEYQPVLDALIRTILPFDHPQFPDVSPEQVRSRLLTLFPLEQDTRFLVLQHALLIFGEVDLFPVLQAPLVSDERRLLGTGAATIAAQARQDERLYAAFLRTSLPSGPRPFISLDAGQRAGYLHLWGQSGFNGKRLFYQAAKRLVMISAYSREDFWPALGYAGPLLPKRS